MNSSRRLLFGLGLSSGLGAALYPFIHHRCFNTDDEEVKSKLLTSPEAPHLYRCFNTDTNGNLKDNQAQLHTDFATNDPQELIAQIEAWTGSHFIPTTPIDRSRETRRQFVDNFLEVSQRCSNYDLIYAEVMRMRYHLDPEQPGDLFLELPFLYCRKAHQYGSNNGSALSRSGAPLAQVGFHYASFTRQLCRAYLLREGHLWTYFRHLW